MLTLNLSIKCQNKQKIELKNHCHKFSKHLTPGQASRAIKKYESMATSSIVNAVNCLTLITNYYYLCLLLVFINYLPWDRQHGVCHCNQ